MIALYLATLALVSVLAFAHALAFAFAPVVAVSALVAETADPNVETEFFGAPIGAEILVRETDERSPLAPMAPTVERKARSAYYGAPVAPPVYRLGTADWGAYYVRARNFREAADALKGAFLAMDQAPPEVLNGGEVPHAPWNANAKYLVSPELAPRGNPFLD